MTEPGQLEQLDPEAFRAGEPAEPRGVRRALGKGASVFPINYARPAPRAEEVESVPIRAGAG